jgi:pectin methylesterase-like acyl-CoA thioesterase
MSLQGNSNIKAFCTGFYATYKIRRYAFSSESSATPPLKPAIIRCMTRTQKMQISHFVVLCLLILPFTQAHALRKRTSRLSSPDGCLIVRGSNTTSGQYATLGAAAEALRSGKTPQCIFIYPREYKEQIFVKYGGNLTIYCYIDK